MKNLIFSFLAVLILSAGTVAFGQVSNSEIAKILSQSKDYNSHVPDLNWIYPGQVLTFEFLDGSIHQIEVEKGDVAWKLVEKLDKLVVIHGPVVEPNQGILPQPKDTTPEYVAPEPLSSWYFFPWGWLVFGICFLAIAIKLLTMVNWKKLREKRKGKFSENPAEEGKPFAESGINSQNALSHFHSLAERSNPGADIRIKEVEPVFVSTPSGMPAVVEFADKTKGNFTFRNQPAFSALVSIDGGKSFKREITLEKCGNPIYMRKSFGEQSNLIITKTPINFGDEVNGENVAENSNPKAAEAVTELEKVSDQKPVVEKREAQSDEVMIVNDHAMVADEFLKTQRAHEVVMEYTKDKDGNVSIKSIFKTKNDPVAPKEEAKKEN